MEASSHHQGKEDVMFTTRTWAITGAAAALILVPAGVSYAVTSASDNTPTVERVQGRQVQQAAYNGPAGGMYGNGYTDQAQGRGRGQSAGQGGDQLRNQVRDPAQNQSRDVTRDQVRDQVRDPSNCDGDGPVGAGPQSSNNSGRGGMMGGRS
jgi:hypothetical protein